MVKLKRILAMLWATMILATGATVMPAQADSGMSSAPGPGVQVVFRLYNKVSHEHLYTPDSNERDILRQGDWNYEGIGWVAPRESETPVYRLYNAALGDHHYTTDRNEVRVLTASHGWVDEGVKWYSSDKKEVTVYRQFHSGLTIGSHNFTTDLNEYRTNNKNGWKGEGAAWYAIEGFSSGKVTQADEKAYGSIEATVRLRGYGDGYHAKLTVSGQNGAIASFGIQHDVDSESPHARTGAVFMSENVMSHATEPGKMGKEYLFYSPAPLDEDVRIRISWYKETNQLRFYVNDEEMARTVTTFTPSLAFSAEGSAKRRGDFVDASFVNVKVKAGDSYENYGIINNWNDQDRGFFGLNSVVAKPGTINYGSPTAQYRTNGEPTNGVTIWVWGRCTIAEGYDWDTSFSLYDKGTNNHPISGYVDIAQKGRYLTPEEEDIHHREDEEEIPSGDPTADPTVAPTPAPQPDSVGAVPLDLEGFVPAEGEGAGSVEPDSVATEPEILESVPGESVPGDSGPLEAVPFESVPLGSVPGDGAGSVEPDSEATESAGLENVSAAGGAAAA